MPSATFASGVLPTTAGEIYRAIKPTSIEMINLFSTNAAQQTVYIYIRRGQARETKRTYARIVMDQYIRADPCDTPLHLSVGDVIMGMTTTANAVEYIIAGQDEARSV